MRRFTLQRLGEDNCGQPRSKYGKDHQTMLRDESGCCGKSRATRVTPYAISLSLQVPNGLAFSDFRGYENWEHVAVSQTENGIKVIVANPTMMAAYRDGLPADGKHFPDGSKVAKIEWTSKRNAASPYFVMVPDTLKSVSFIEKDIKRF